MKRGIKQSVGTVIFRMILRIFLVICALSIMFPIVWLLTSSLKNNMEFYSDPFALPTAIRIVNYILAWGKSNISVYFMNSLLVILGTLILFVIMLATNAYIIAKYDFRGKKLMESFYFAAMMIPSVLLLTPLYFQLQEINLTDNLLVLMAIYAVQGLPVPLFMVTGFVKNIDNSFLEAAVIDGASEWQIFSKVVVPMVKPILFFSCLGNVMGTWNEYTTALVFISSETKYTVSIGLHFLEQAAGDKGVLFAGLVIALLPILILYGIFQKQIQDGVSASDGVKG